jgi:hypothetical protein
MRRIFEKIYIPLKHKNILFYLMEIVIFAIFGCGLLLNGTKRIYLS